jgi:HPt (histidine-containing phosphotransfer) domain-containing protein
MPTPTEDDKETAMSAQQRIDQMKLYLCNQFQLSPEQVGDMLPNFIVTLSSHMAHMERTLGENDLMALGKAGHTMKGALLNLGLTDCAELALHIEERGKAGDRCIDYASLVADLRKQIGPLFS